MGRTTRGSDCPELALLELLVRLACDEPTVAQLLMREGLAAGPKLLEERERLIGGLSDAIQVAERPPAIDIPERLLIGGIFRFLSLRLDVGKSVEGIDRNSLRHSTG
ncbi:MAG TPA: hypothetical protein VK691_01270 [Solirubrobacteraceae bacterium]|nr:hypothetical protein [Solirubrobacteraceae bacterium]